MKSSPSRSGTASYSSSRHAPLLSSLPRLGGRHAGILPDVLRVRPKSSSLHPVERITRARTTSPPVKPLREPELDDPACVRKEVAAAAEGLRAAATRATPPRRSSHGRAARRHCRGSARAARDAVPEPGAHRGRDGFEQLRECAPRPARRSSPERRCLRRRRCARSAARARADLPVQARDVPGAHANRSDTTGRDHDPAEVGRQRAASRRTSRTSRGAPRKSSASPMRASRERHRAARVIRDVQRARGAGGERSSARARRRARPRRGAPAEAGATVARTTASARSSPRTVSAGSPCTSRSPCTAPPGRSGAAR